MDWTPVGASVVAVLVALSGCASDGDSTSKASPGSTAPPPDAPAPSPDAETGSINGTVLNDEEAPLVGAQLLLTPTDATAQTDESGSFTFNQLQPGKYTVFVRMLGYEDVARRVEVNANEVIDVRIVLSPVPLPGESYYLSIPRTSFLQAGNGLVGGTLQFIVPTNTSTVVDALCNSCRYTLFVDAGPVQVLSEAVWAPPTVPQTNEIIELWYFLSNGTTYLERDFEDVYLGSREQHKWGAASVTLLKKVRQISVEVIAAETGVSFQHKVEAWATFAYGEELAEEFTALPPP